MRKSLLLRRETLSELTDDQLDGFGAAASTYCTCGLTMPCFTLDACPIPTLPVRTCFDPD